MKLISVNVSIPQQIIHNGKPVMTGIFKLPVQGRVTLQTINLEGDQQADLRVHGGKYKAVYVYPHEHYAYWQDRLNQTNFHFGQFGENLTSEGLTEETVHIGDRFEIGAAVVEVTQPRVPCFKLEHKMGIPGFIKTFMDAEKTGFYLRVIQEGEIGAGDSIKRVKMGEEQMTVQEIFHLLYFDSENIQAAQRAVSIPALSKGWKDSFKKLLAKES